MPRAEPAAVRAEIDARRRCVRLAIDDARTRDAVAEALSALGYVIESAPGPAGEPFDGVVLVDEERFDGIASARDKAERAIDDPWLLLAKTRASTAIPRAIELDAADYLILPDDLVSLDQRLALVERRRWGAPGDVHVSWDHGRRRSRQLLGSEERQARELQLLHQVRSAIAVDLELPSIFRKVVEQVHEIFGYSHVSLYQLEDGVLVLQHQVGYDQVIERISLDRGVAGRVARTGEAVFLEDVAADPDFLAAIPEIASEICVPFFLEGDVAGIFNVESVSGRPLSRADLRMIAEVTGFLGLAAERSRLMSAIRDREQRLRLALEAAGMGTWIWFPQSGDVYWSEQMGPLYGLPAGTPQISAEHWFALIHPEDRDTVRRTDRQLMRFGEDYEIEFRVVLPNGVTRWLEGKGKVVERSAEGEVVSIVGVTMDITGRKRLEEERMRLVQLETERAKANEARRMITDTLERMTAGFVAVDRDWRLTFLNHRALTMLGRTGQQLAGNIIWEVFPRLEGTRVATELRTASDSQEVANFDVLWPGVERWFEVHIYPASDGLSIYLQDVTERRQADEDRRRTEARFRSLVQNASDIVLILDRRGIVRYASPAVERVIGLAPEEIIGSDNFALVHPQDAKRLRRAFVRVAKTPGVGTPIVLRFRHRLGGYRWLEVTATNLFADSAIDGIVANCRDVTERHDAEFNLWFLAETSAMLGTSLELETTLTSISRLVVMNLGDMCIVDVVNEQFEREADAIAHRNSEIERNLVAFRAAHPLNRASPYGPGYVLRTGRSLLYGTIDEEIGQLWLSSADERIDSFDFAFRSAVLVPMFARGFTIGVLTVASHTAGRFTGVELGLVEELARRAAMAVDNARLYRSARAAVEARDQFLSVAAHELRTPITAITGFTSLLEREVNTRSDPVRVHRFVRRLNDAGGRLSLLVDDMLDVSRIRWGQLPLRIAPVDLGLLLTRVRQRYEEQETISRNAFVLSLPDHACVVPGDEDRLDQVLSNVIDNALKYGGEGEIVIDMADDADGYLLRVTDSGIGLPSNEHESIFRPFGRAANADTSSVSGLGIGLYISRNIVERHGGRIWAESDGEGLGTTFAIWLPIAAAGDLTTGD